MLIMPTAAFGPQPPPNLFPHILQVRLGERGKGPFLETTTFTDSGQSQHLLSAFCSCDWPNIPNNSYAANIFIPLYHFRINCNYCSHPEDTGSTFFRNVGTFSNYIMQKPKRRPSFEKQQENEQKWN
jgi:hypothetical protein